MISLYDTLGLGIVERIAKEHGGELLITNDEESVQITATLLWQ